MREPVPTPAEARRIWESTPNPSSRRVARKLSQSGARVSHMTVSRWRRRGWRPVVKPEHPLDTARAALDDALPLVTGDPSTNAAAFAKNSADEEKLKHLSDAQLIRKASRELAIAVIVVVRAIIHQATDLVIHRTREVAVLLLALSACVTAFTTSLAHTRTIEGSIRKRRESDRAHARSLDEAMEAFRKGRAP